MSTARASTKAGVHDLTTIGRAEDVDRVVALVKEGAPVVTLFGTAGIGKSTLARAVRARLVDEGWSVVTVDLSETTTADGMLMELGAQLAPSLGREQPTLDAIHAALRERARTSKAKRSLLLLDGVDRVVAAVSKLLDAGPAANTLTTSREVLAIASEHVYEVLPLALPALGATSSPAIAMLLARARRIGWAPRSDADTKALVEIAHLLEGIPLALELAAGRLAVLSAPELSTRLSTRLPLLSAPLRLAKPRQRTMHAALSWTFSQLEDFERAALVQLAVFRGGFDASSAEAVLDLRAFPDAPAAVDVLMTLRNKSFLCSTDVDARFTLFHVVRELCEQADGASESLPGAITRHAAWVLSRTEPLTRATIAAGDPHALASLVLERDNLLVAHARAVAQKTVAGAEIAARCVAALAPLVGSRLTAQHAEELATRTLAGEKLTRPALEAEVLLVRSVALDLAGGTLAAADAEAARSLAVEIDDADLVARADVRLGGLDVRAGAVDRGIDRLTRACTTFGEDTPRLAANARLALATALRLRGRLSEAETSLVDAVAIHRRAGDARGEALGIGCIGALAYQSGELPRAVDALTDARDRALALGDEYSAGYAEGTLGLVQLERGDHAGAAALLEGAIARLERLGERRLVSAFRGYEAILAHLEGRFDVARLRYEDALRLLEVQDDDLHVGLISGAAAALAYAVDDPNRAEVLLSRAETALARVVSSHDAALAHVVPLHRAHAQLHTHRVALGKHEERLARRSLAQAQRVLSSARAAVLKHDEARMAYRLLDAAIAPYARPLAKDACGDAALVVGGTGSWFRVGTSPRVDLRRRRPLRLVLAALVDHRVKSPNVAVPSALLVARGWPAEQIRADAALGRLYVCIRALRDLGLREALLQQDAGYLLDPAISIDVVSEEPLGERT